MFLTGGFDGFDVIDSRFWWFWQVVLMVLMILTGGFDGFDSRFWCFDSRFWCFWWFWQVVLMVLIFWQQVLMFLMILTEGFDDFEGCIINDSRFWCFWWFWQKVFVFEGCILNHVIHTEGFVLWRRCYQEIPFPPAASHTSISGAVLWKTVKCIPHKHLFFLKQKIKPTSRL